MCIMLRRSADAVRFLLAVPGIDVNVTDHRITTPLHWAAVCNRPEVQRHTGNIFLSVVDLAALGVPDAAAARGAADGARWQ